jgi:ketosteroid isomerase-like protein
VWFMTLKDGKVIHFRDYMNPLQLLEFDRGTSTDR